MAVLGYLLRGWPQARRAVEERAWHGAAATRTPWITRNGLRGTFGAGQEELKRKLDFHRMHLLEIV